MRSLEELALAYQSGDTEAIEEIVIRCSRIVRNVARRYFLIGASLEDVDQEGYLGLIKAVKTFNPSKGSFKNYASICINSSVLTAVRRYAGDKNKILNDGLPLSVVDQTIYTENPEDIYIEGECEREFFDKMSSDLSSFENKVLSLYLQGLNYMEMEGRLGKPKKAIDNALQRIKKKLKNKTVDGE